MSGLANATEKFRETLERKWAAEGKNSTDVTTRIEECKHIFPPLAGCPKCEANGKTEDVSQTQPQDTNNSYGGEVLEPVIATKYGKCCLCKSYIDRGESIVSADGENWAHRECAEKTNWVVA